MSDWQDDAACRDMNPELFFTESIEGNKRYALAKKVCRSCPVKDECLRAAVSRGEEFGVWGGLTPEQWRRHIGKYGFPVAPARRLEGWEKTCSKCDVSKDGSEFSVLARARDGKQVWCRSCMREAKERAA